MMHLLTESQFAIIIVGVFACGWLLRMIYQWEIIEKRKDEDHD